SGYSRPNVEPKQLVPSSKASTTLGTEGNLELLAEEQVVHDEALTAADGGGECVEEELDEFEHRGRIADPRSRLDRRMVVCSPTGLLRAGSISDLATPGPLLSCPSGNQPVEAPEVVFNREHPDLLEARVRRVGTEGRGTHHGPGPHASRLGQAHRQAVKDAEPVIESLQLACRCLELVGCALVDNQHEAVSSCQPPHGPQRFNGPAHVV